MTMRAHGPAITKGDEATMPAITAQDFDDRLMQNISAGKPAKEVLATRVQIINDFRDWLLKKHGLQYLPEGVTHLAFQVAWASHSHGGTEEVYAAFSDYAQLLHRAYKAGLEAGRQQQDTPR